MPRGKTNTTKSPASARKSPRGASAVTETKEDVKPTRSRSTRGSAASESPSPKKPRRTSPSPASATRESRGRSAKKTEAKPSPAGKGSKQDRGDNEVEAGTKKGRVTRAVVQEAETTSRGRSRGRKVSPPPAEEPAKSRTRTPAKKEKVKPVTPAKTSKGRSKSRSSTKNTPTPPKKQKVSTSRSRSRGKKEDEDDSDLPSAQIVLTKCDSPAKSPRDRKTAKQAEEKPREKSRSRSRSKPTPKSTPKSTPSPKAKAARPSPGSRSRRGRKSEETEEKEDTQAEEEKEAMEETEDKTAEKMEEKDSEEAVEGANKEESEEIDVKDEEKIGEAGVKDDEEESTAAGDDEKSATAYAKDEEKEENEAMDVGDEDKEENAEVNGENKKTDDVQEEEKGVEEPDDVQEEEEKVVETEDVQDEGKGVAESDDMQEEEEKVVETDDVQVEEKGVAATDTVQEEESKESGTTCDKDEEIEQSAKQAAEVGSVEKADVEKEEAEEKAMDDEPEISEEQTEEEPTQKVEDVEMEEEQPAEVEASKEELTLEEKSVEKAVEEAEKKVEVQEATESVEDVSRDEAAEEAHLPNDAATPVESVVEDAAMKPEAATEVTQDQNSLPQVSIEENGGAVDTGLVSPSRKRKFDDTDDAEDDILPKKVRRSIDAVDVSCEDGVVKENGEENASEQAMEITTDTDVQQETTDAVKSAEQEAAIESEYVVIEMTDVPAANSEEIQQSLPSQEASVVAEANTDKPAETEQAKPLSDSAVTLDTTSSSVGSSALYNREFIPNPSFTSVGINKQFSVCSYNILAQCHLERNDYSFTDPKFLNLNHRHQEMMKEVEYLDADVVCMQEVGPEYYNSLLLPHMERLGYQGVMKKRLEEYFDEGEASFYKTSRFTLVESVTYSLKELGNQELQEGGVSEEVETAIKKYLDLPDVLIILKLKCNNTGNILTLGNVHIQWGKMETPDAQCIQIVSAIKELVKKAGSDSQALVLCGDFNSEVSSPGYRLTTEGYLSDEVLKQLQALENLEMVDGSKAALVNHLWRAFQHTSNLKSAYATTQKSEPKVTSYNKVMLAAVDYIFYSAGSLDTVGVLQTASPEKITATGGIPDEIFPSDHVSLKAVLSFT